MKSTITQRFRSFLKGEMSTAQPTSVADLARADLLERREVLQAFRDVQKNKVGRLLKEVDAALARISDGNYGRCSTCNEQIHWLQLLANPLEQHCFSHLDQDSQRLRQIDRDAGIRLRTYGFYPFKQRYQVSFSLAPEVGCLGSDDKVPPAAGRAGAKPRLKEQTAPLRRLGRSRKPDKKTNATVALSLEEMVKDSVRASDLQSSLLPQRGLRVGPWETSYAYAPARTVCGDYCDLITDPGSGELIFCFGDGMGKGMVGSIIASLLHALFRALVSCRKDEVLTAVVERANRLLCQEFSQHDLRYYATTIIGRALPDGVLEVVNAGHPPAFHLGNGNPVTLGATGLPLGLFYSSTYESKTVQMGVGEAVLMYTDGITEAQDADGIEYGRERLIELATRNDSLCADDLVNTCVEDVRAFTADAPASDDQMVMVVRRT